jgi:hypothetical protein
MSITKYSNFEDINKNIENEGKFLQYDDLFIVTKGEIEDTDFGECKYDVMEVSVYDINNNLLPQKSGNNVAYIKTGDIKNYMYNVTNTVGKKEFAIDIETLLNKLGFTNGILKVNINFVRNRVGSENELTRVWIQEISPSREEIRILPLKVSDSNITEKNKKDFSNINNLNQDFKYYKKQILDTLDSFENENIIKINDAIVSKFGNDFLQVLKKDFGLSNFETFRNRIFSNFKDSVTYWVNNKEYDITQSNYGNPLAIKRFEDCEQYDFQNLIAELQNILFKSVEVNIKTLKRRNTTIKSIPKEFTVVELRKEIKDNVNSYATKTETKRIVYSPNTVSVAFDDVPPQPPIIEYPKTEISVIDVPPIEPQLIPATVIKPIYEPAPIIIPDIIEDAFFPIQDTNIDTPFQIPDRIIDTPIEYTSGGGGSRGGGTITNQFDRFDDIRLYEDRSMEIQQ